jgi:hypothetical protein
MLAELVDVLILLEAVSDAVEALLPTFGDGRGGIGSESIWTTFVPSP